VNADITISHILNSLFSKESVIWETTDKIDRVIYIQHNNGRSTNSNVPGRKTTKQGSHNHPWLPTPDGGRRPLHFGFYQEQNNTDLIINNVQNVLTLAFDIRDKKKEHYQ
jgi:hypothetical protein